jgi:signal transduction histidine kinase
VTSHDASASAAANDDASRRPNAWRSIVTQARRWGAIVLALCLGWLVTQGVFRLTGTPPALLAFLITVAVIVVLGGVVGVLVVKITGRTPRDAERVAADLIAALGRISHGDFDVRLPELGDDPMADLVTSVNRMARDLGDLEQQRQDFVSNVSHEIQSPLTSIGGFAELLGQPGLDEATRDHYLDVIRAETRRVSALGANLLRLSSLDSVTQLDKVEYQLGGQLRSVVIALEPQWTAAGLDVALDVPDGLCVAADEDMLRQVFINLVQNAIKYAHTPGGHIRVSASAGTGGDRPIPAHRIFDDHLTSVDSSTGPRNDEVDRPRAGVRIDVADDGIGISAADLPHVFERFFRADRSRTGSGNGLGLALARRIVELHGGALTVDSELGVGSTFTVRLP